MQNFVIVRKSSSVYLVEAGVLSSGYPNSSRLLFLAERGGAFLQEPGVKFEIVLTELLQTGWLTRWVWSN